jgi:tetratricopeptide (TPR) repeat protein
VDAQPLTFRVFLSSPGDVAEERRSARDVMEALEGSHLLRGKVRFDILEWNDEHAAAPMDARETPQASVNRYTGRPADCDLTLVILWSRIGTPLPPDVVRANGTPYESGTVWEFEDARAGGKPIFVYRRTGTPQIDLDDPELEIKRGQYDAVKAFFAGFTSPDGSLQAGFNGYRDPDAFARLLRQHLEAFVNQRLDARAAASAEAIAPDDPQVVRIATLIDEIGRKNRQLDERDAEIASLRRENEELRRAAIARTLTAAAQPDAAPAAVAAATALEAGDTRPAEALLRDREETQAQLIAAGGAETTSRQHAAQLARQQGALAMGHDVRAAIAAYQRAAGYDPDDVWTQLFIGDLHRQLGNLDAAMRSYRTASATAAKRVRASPDDPEAQRGLMASHNRIGHVLGEQGASPDALAAYRKGLAIAERLSLGDPDNLDRLTDLVLSHSNVAAVLLAQGDASGAIASYNSALAIAEVFCTPRGFSAGWRRELVVSYGNIGDVMLRLGDARMALAWYRAVLIGAQALAESDPANPERQRDVMAAHERIGKVLVEQGDGAGALAVFEDALAIANTLTARDPANAVWQRDLSVCYDRVGEALIALGDRPRALEVLRAGQAIAETLAARDPQNTEWQRDLSARDIRIADVLRAVGDEEKALAALRRALAIREALVARDPASAEWSTDLAVAHAKLGDHAHGLDADERRRHLTRGRDILMKLKKEGRLMPVQDWIAWFDDRLRQLDAGPLP